MHDVGKIGVPDAVLGKQGPLTDEEWEAIKQHPSLRREPVIPYILRLGSLGNVC